MSTEDSESGETEKTTLGRPRFSATSGPDRKAPSATTTSGRTSSTSRSISATQPGTGRRKMLRMSHRSRAMPPLMGSSGVGTWSSSKSSSPRIGRWSAPVAVHGGAERAAGVPGDLVSGLDEPAGQGEGRVHVAGGGGGGDEYASHGIAFRGGSGGGRDSLSAATLDASLTTAEHRSHQECGRQGRRSMDVRVLGTLEVRDDDGSGTRPRQSAAADAAGTAPARARRAAPGRLAGGAPVVRRLSAGVTPRLVADLRGARPTDPAPR